MKIPSPALMRTCGFTGFLIFGLGFLYLGNLIFNLNLNVWMLSWSDLGVKGVILIIVAFIIAMIGNVIGLGIGVSIKVKSERTDFIISSLWHYAANGSVLWLIIWTMYLTKRIGAESAKEFAENVGAFPWICFLAIPVIGCLLIAILLLLLGLLNEYKRPTLLSCLIPSVPIVMAMGYIQMNLFRMDGYSWVIIGILMPVILIYFCAFMIARDKFQREEMKKIMKRREG